MPAGPGIFCAKRKIRDLFLAVKIFCRIGRTIFFVKNRIGRESYDGEKSGE